MKPLLSALFVLLIATVPALAEEEVVSNYKLAMVNWGETLTGDTRPGFKPETLKKRIVIVEEFGVKTPACVERLKDLARLDKKLTRDKTPATIIAIHRQRDVPDATVLETAKKERVEFTLRKNGFLPASIGGMPHAAIFLPDGTMFWHGDSTGREFDKALKGALAKAAE